tara:strand:- start:14373 stop:14930 length:558 start_codon:yes stop_codon:yes gene_type:complete
MEYEFRVIPDEQTPKTPTIEDVEAFIEEHKELIAEFKLEAQVTSNAIGLAANQCELNGERLNLRMAAIKDVRNHETRIAIDPVITKAYGMLRTKIEGCLTWKGRSIVADRYHFVDVEFYTPDGEFHQETHKGFQAQVWQHEINHLNGVEEDVETFFVNVERGRKIGRNEPCPCGSGLRYKKCCIE